jgi:hypothetical protein
MNVNLDAGANHRLIAILALLNLPDADPFLALKNF